MIKKNRILIIDDDPDIRSLMDIALKREGYVVETASKKEEVMEKLEQFQPSVVLLDVLLSGSDGRTICKEIKESDRSKNITVIMVSAHPGAADNISSYGADDFIAKPFNVNDVLTRLNDIFEKV
ncbi:MAG: PleD family two-component system response regulator [Flavisolibacter sp.]